MFWGAGAPSRILPAAHKERNAQHSTWSSSLSVVIMIILVMMMVTINNPSLLLPTCQNHHDAITLCHAVWTVRLITWSAQSCDWFGPPSLKPAQIKSGRTGPQKFLFSIHRWLIICFHHLLMFRKITAMITISRWKILPCKMVRNILSCKIVLLISKQIH